jgi:RNA polymerase-binding transcription factor DksA
VNARELKRFEKRLLEEREKLVKQLGSHAKTLFGESQRDSAGDLSAYSYHMADLGSDAMEREKEFLMASAEGRMLNDINDALRKVHSKEYGKCEACEAKIPKERLDIVPQARLCVPCQEEQEEREGGS